MFSDLFPQITAPVPLWETGLLGNVRNQSDPSPHQPPSNVVQSSKPNTPLHSAQKERTAQAPKATSDFFTVGKSPSDNSRDQKRPPSGKSGGGHGGVGGGRGGFVPVNATSIGAYKQIKKSLGEARLDAASSSKGES